MWLDLTDHEDTKQFVSFLKKKDTEKEGRGKEIVSNKSTIEP